MLGSVAAIDPGIPDRFITPGRSTSWRTATASVAEVSGVGVCACACRVGRGEVDVVVDDHVHAGLAGSFVSRRDRPSYHRMTVSVVSDAAIIGFLRPVNVDAAVCGAVEEPAVPLQEPGQFGCTEQWPRALATSMAHAVHASDATNAQPAMSRSASSHVTRCHRVCRPVRHACDPHSRAYLLRRRPKTTARQ